MKEIDLVNNINAYLHKYGIRYANEVRMGVGIPDISLNIGANKKQALIFDYYVLSLYKLILDNNIKTIDKINGHISFPDNNITRYIDIMCQKNLISVNDSKIKIRRAIFNYPLGTVVSIEAKMRDWKAGLLQAQRYLVFSDYSGMFQNSCILQNGCNHRWLI